MDSHAGDSLDAYAAYLRRRHMAAGTIAHRLPLVRRYRRHVPHWRHATRADAESFLDTLSVGPATTYATISHLHAFYRWARREGLTAADPFADVDRPRLPRRLPRPAPRDGVRLAVECADLTMRAVLLLMVLAGLRCCEIARLSWADVEFAERRLWVRGKRDRDRVVAIPPELAPALRAVFVLGGGPVVHWSARDVSIRVNAHLRACGVAATAHQLRHRYATDLISRHGVEIVQAALGHANIDTTMIYAAVDVSRVLAATADLTL